MKQVLALCCGSIDGAPFIHIYKFLLRDLFVEILIKLPQHPLDVSLAHPHAHLPQDLFYFALSEILALMLVGQEVEHCHQVFFFVGVDFKLL